MPAPTAYTEETLVEYMADVIKDIATDLNFAAYEKPVHDVEIALGIADIATATDPVELIRIQARIAIWREVVEAYVRTYGMGGLQRNLQRYQLYDHARQMLLDAESDLKAYLDKITQTEMGQVGAVPPSAAVRVNIVW